MDTSHDEVLPIVESPGATHPLTATIEVKLEDTRRRLLDLTRRNRLLNHRTSGRATLRIVDELPSEVFRQLVLEDKSLQFLAREEASREAAALVAAEASSDGEGEREEGLTFTLAPIDATEASSRHSDKNLQTAISGEQLQARLLHLARQAESAREEQGCNILYIALGVVEWREKPNDPPSRAPLIFIPADLERRTVKNRHSLKRFEDDILVNPCLVELCRRIFHFDLPLVEIDETVDIEGYFARVTAVMRDLPDWRFLPEVHLGLFSFAKLLMYRDLDPANWPTQQRLTQHPLIRRLSGFPAPLLDDDKSMPRAEALDETVLASESFQVVDADSSQQVAIQAIKSGLNPVIEGPPGTGKSQTITNIIAESLAAGKTVLFVAEKAAALSVVKRRLEAVGLGDYILELHSNKTSKRIVLDELQRTLTVFNEPLPVGRYDPGVLEQSRARLNDYARSLHRPLSSLDISPYEAMVRQLAVRDVPEADIVLDQPLTWDAARLYATHECIEAFERWRLRVGNVATHPWQKLTLQYTNTLTRQRIQRALEDLVISLRQLHHTIQITAGMLEISAPVTRHEADVLIERFDLLLNLPNLLPGMIRDERWEAQAEAIDAWIASGLQRQQRKVIWSQSFVTEAEKQEWNQILQHRHAHEQSLAHKAMPVGLEDKLMRWMSSEWKTDAQQIDAYLLPNAKPTVRQLFQQITAILESAGLRVQVLAGVQKHADLLRNQWQDIDGDWEHLDKVVRAVLDVRRMIADGMLSEPAAEYILGQSDRNIYARQVEAFTEATTRVVESFSAWYAAAETSEVVWLERSWQDIPLDDLIARHESLRGAFEELEVWVQYRESRAQLAAFLPAFLDWTEQTLGEHAVALVDCFDRQFYQLWLDDAFQQRPILAAFRGEDHEALVQRFAVSDERWIVASRRRVAGLVRSRVPDLGRESHRQSKLGILKAEIRKKRRHMALRKLLVQTGEVLQALKPCFMMSPISIAQYLSPGAIQFDLVIFDEASQVEPADAYGAIARGRQLILVGDEKQLPPTNFFNKIESDTPLGDDEDFAAGDLESVLSLGVVRLPHQCSLRWHYRSRHSSLIEFSNQQFYDGNLRVFPGPYASTSAFGLQFHYVDNGVYMRGAGQHNPNEASAVALAVIQHALTTPNVTLGVGAFSVAQQRAIEDEIERLRRNATDPRVEAFFIRQSNEPFFVKNLETIQGDERDVIMLTVGYGPDQQGKLTMNFGPLNRDGGWRRLNVLVTRARQRCVLFSSIRSDQINLGGTRARGVAALKSYLYLAEHGHAPDLGHLTDAKVQALAPLISSTLRTHGWQVHERVGTVGSFVDLAVIDPDQPERYLVGIETDGDVYGEAATTRDRERLRPQVLSQLGWNLHRVWTLDWYQRPQSAIQRLLKQLESGRTRTVSLPVQQTEHIVDAIPIEDAVQVAANSNQPNKIVEPYAASVLRTTVSTIGIDSISVPVLTHVIRRIIFDESPIHEDEVQRVVAAHFTTRVSKRIQQACHPIVAELVQNGVIRRQDAFLWIPSMTVPPVRYRSDVCPVTKPELIAAEELQTAVRYILSEQFGLHREALITSAARLLGFRRCGTALEAAIGAAVDHLVTTGEAILDQQHFITLRG